MRNVNHQMTEDQRQILQWYTSTDPGIWVVGAGGSRFTAKTHTGVWCIGLRRLEFPNTKALVLRQVMSSTKLNLGDEFRSQFFDRMGIPLGSVSRGNAQYLEKESQFLLPNNSMIQLAYCHKKNDWRKHVGEQWDDIWMEQGEDWPESIFDKFKGSNRPNNPECPPRMLISANPGGIGGEWIERRLVNPATKDRRTRWLQTDIYRALATLEHDPSYIMRSLLSIRDPILRGQWLGGRWDLLSGQKFKLHPPMEGFAGTVQERNVPYWADWYAGVDWGRAKPFACIWVATWVDRFGDRWAHIPAEVYQAGLELDEQARAVLEKEKFLKDKYPHMHMVQMRLADPSTANPMEKTTEEQTRTISSIWGECGMVTYPAMPYSRITKWEILQYLMTNRRLTIDPSCMALIKEIMGAVRKEDSEDVDESRSSDHALDASGYVLTDDHVFGIEFVRRQEKTR